MLAALIKLTRTLLPPRISQAKLAQHIDHSLESAEEKRRAVLRKVQFKASNVVQKHKVESVQARP